MSKCNSIKTKYLDLSDQTKFRLNESMELKIILLINPKKKNNE